MQCDILHADETFIKLMVKGAKKCKQAYMWCRLTGVGPPIIAFHFSPSRSRDVAKSLLGDYSGTIIRDSYVAYEKLDCEVACCWAHVRRRFLQAIECGYTKAEAPLKMIQALYQIERGAKERAEKKGTETVCARQPPSAALLQQSREWMDAGPYFPKQAANLENSRKYFTQTFACLRNSAIINQQDKGCWQDEKEQIH